MKWQLGSVLIYGWVISVSLASPPLDVRSFGAKGNGRDQDTSALQTAIDNAAEQNGGDVLLPPGRYLSGSLRLKNNVSLILSNGAVLVWSPEESAGVTVESQAPNSPALLTGDGLHGVAIRGGGTIEMNGGTRSGSQILALRNSSHISVQGVSFVLETAGSGLLMEGCTEVTVTEVTIRGSASEGITLEGSSIVQISGSHIEAEGQSLVIRTGRQSALKAVNMVTVRDCFFQSNVRLLSLMAGQGGSMSQVLVKNCLLKEGSGGKGKSNGISVFASGQSEIEDVSFLDLIMDGVAIPAFLSVGAPAEGESPGVLRDVTIEDLAAKRTAGPILIAGRPEAPVRNVTLAGLRVGIQNAGKLEVQVRPEAPQELRAGMVPEEFPADLLWASQVEGLLVRDVHVQSSAQTMQSHLAMDHVRGLDLDGFMLDSAGSGPPAIWLHQSKDIFLTRCRVRKPVGVFLLVTGRESEAIGILGNDFRLAEKVVEVKDGASQFSVEMTSNLARRRLPAID